MYKLHIYNPEHDMALARNSEFFTPPKAALLIRRRYGHIPAFWADDGDWVLVDDAANAERMLALEVKPCANVKFVETSDLKNLTKGLLPQKILPWGWDRVIVKTLLDANPLFSAMVPSVDELDEIRRLSSRRFASEEILPFLRSLDSSLVGEMSVFSSSLDELENIVSCSERLVLKSPWSCSGRGVRMVSESLDDSEKGWCRRVLQEQGFLMIEPLYDRVLDIGAEFMIDDGGVRYLGLNIFETQNGAFRNNVALSEEERKRLLLSYIAGELYDKVIQGVLQVTSNHFCGHYSGPFGIDMMVVNDKGGFALHPCVELNLRRTMGHGEIGGKRAVEQ